MVVEDEEPLGVLLRYNLEAEGYQVEIVTRGDEAEIRLQEHAPDLLVLDWMVPGDLRHRALPAAQDAPRNAAPADHHADGARRGKRPRPRAFDRRRRLSGQAVLDARIHGAREGAAAPRQGRKCCRRVLKVGDIVLDREAHRVYRKKNEIKLGPTEFRLLEFMMRHPGRVFSRGQLLDNVWGETIYIDERTVDVHVGRLRKAVNTGRMPDVIRTIRGAGYAIRED